ncbi:cation channel family protein [Stylonychia lemnae]|uniref:Cation channel family protein n=1 Tax=Stylonychia lemnae TaxID=5949 RepID=A0A078A485_STYLE|nr:cation channel family protein [Stylonychia lemnae]|eukprot:CDW76967.1 cation channel family protein [Stylonychia lemnae]
MGDASNYLLSVTDQNLHDQSFADYNTRDIPPKNLFNQNNHKVKVVKTAAMEVDEADYNTSTNIPLTKQNTKNQDSTQNTFDVTSPSKRKKSKKDVFGIVTLEDENKQSQNSQRRFSMRKGDSRVSELENSEFDRSEQKQRPFLDSAAFGLETSAINEGFNIAVEVLFGVDIILKYISEEDFYPVRDIKKIAIRYLKRSFIFDMLSVIPFRYFIKDAETRQLCSLFKILRLPKLFLLLDSRNFKHIIKTYYDNKLQRVLKNVDMKHDQLQDNNNIMLQIMINYAFKVLRLIIVIFSISYFIGTLWYIFTWQIDDPNDDTPNSNFFKTYGMRELKKNNDDINSMIIVVYFAFTTLATVGYGDYHAVSDSERVVCSIILLFGVAVFSFIMGNFIEILMSFKIVTAQNEESENLTKWLGLLARFNKGRPLPKEMIRKIENYFDYYWAQDRNYALKSQDDLRFMQELPKQIRINIFREFLFKNFLYQFRSYFTIERDPSELNDSMSLEDSKVQKLKFYNWNDTQYAQFMMNIMQNLEPRKYQRNDLILYDLEEVDEVIYVCSGQYGVGYQLNNQEYIAVKIGQKSVIGDHSVVFRKRSEFMYRALGEMDCYGLRKNRLYTIFDKYKEFSAKMKKNISSRYQDVIRKNVLEHKQKTIEKIKRIYKIEYSLWMYVSNPLDEEKELKKEMENKAGEGQAAMRRVKKLEQKVEKLGNSVYQLFKKYDNQLQELMTI